MPQMLFNTPTSQWRSGTNSSLNYTILKSQEIDFVEHLQIKRDYDEYKTVFDSFEARL
jgi:hypothetical protein